MTSRSWQYISCHFNHSTSITIYSSLFLQVVTRYECSTLCHHVCWSPDRDESIVAEIHTSIQADAPKPGFMWFSALKQKTTMAIINESPHTLVRIQCVVKAVQDEHIFCFNNAYHSIRFAKYMYSTSTVLSMLIREAWCLNWWVANIGNIMVTLDTKCPYWDKASTNNTQLHLPHLESLYIESCGRVLPDPQPLALLSTGGSSFTACRVDKEVPHLLIVYLQHTERHLQHGKHVSIQTSRTDPRPTFPFSAALIGQKFKRWYLIQMGIQWRSKQVYIKTFYTCTVKVLSWGTWMHTSYRALSATVHQKLEQTTKGIRLQSSPIVGCTEITSASIVSYMECMAILPSQSHLFSNVLSSN